VNTHEVNRRFSAHALAETEYLGIVFRESRVDDMSNALYWLLTDLWLLVDRADRMDAQTTLEPDD
jgi:hypothetical protein